MCLCVCGDVLPACQPRTPAPPAPPPAVTSARRALSVAAAAIGSAASTPSAPHHHGRAASPPSASVPSVWEIPSDSDDSLYAGLTPAEVAHIRSMERTHTSAEAARTGASATHEDDDDDGDQSSPLLLPRAM
jgi:hypothetical protein